MDIADLRIHPFTGAPQWLQISGELQNVPTAGNPFAYLDEIPVEDPAYPMTVQIIDDSGGSNVMVSQDATISEEAPTTNFGSLSTLRTGRASAGSGGRYRPLLTFPIGSVPPGFVASAYLNVFMNDTSGVGGFPNPRSIGVHRITGSWNESSVTWSSQPSHNPVAESVVRVAGSTWYRWNITQFVNTWYANWMIANPNWATGLMLKDGNETASDTPRDWVSSEGSSTLRPYISAVPWSGSLLTKTSSYPPGTSQYCLNSNRGVIAVNGTHAGKKVSVTYYGKGTNICANILNRMIAGE